MVVGVPLPASTTSSPPTSCTSRRAHGALQRELSGRDPQLVAAAVRRQARRLSRPGDPDLVQGGLDRALSRPVRGVLRDPARPDGVPHPLRNAGGVRGLGRAHADAGRRRSPPRPRHPRQPTRSARPAPVRASSQEAQADPLVAQGETLFRNKGCIGCHALQAKGAPTALIGPNLANVGARAYIAAGWLKNTDENLEAGSRTPRGSRRAC